LIIFPRKIKGKSDRLSITIPRKLARDYGLEPGVYIKVTLRKTPKDTENEIQFAKKIAKCGYEGTLIYIPTTIVQEYKLEYGMTFWVMIEEAF
jgi:hypothetical protein